MKLLSKVLHKAKNLGHKLLIDKNLWYKRQFPYCKKFWNRFPFNLQVVNLGSNTGLFGFRYDGLPIKAANWALSPQSFNQDLAILKTYYSYIGPRGTILVPLGPYSSCLKNYTDTEWMKYFTILHPGVTPNFSIEKQQYAYQLKNHPFKYARKQMIKGLILTIIKSLLGYKEPLSYTTCPFSKAQIEANAQSFINGWMKQFNVVDMDAPRPEHINEGRKKRVATLMEMWQFCRDRDLKMYVVLPPVTKALSKKFSPTFRENYIYSFLQEAGIPNDHFLNYLDDENLQKDEYFYNSLFLNKRGGESFTKQVLKDLQLI